MMITATEESLNFAGIEVLIVKVIHTRDKIGESICTKRAYRAG